MRDLRDIASAFTRGVRTPEGEPVTPNETARRLVFRVLPELLDEVERLRRDVSERTALHDTLLAKDFLALFGYARAVAEAREPARLDLAIEGLALQLARLEPLHDDVRRMLALRQRPDVCTLTLPIGDRLTLVLRELAPLVGVSFADVALLALLTGADDLIDRFVADEAAIARLRTEVQQSVPRHRVDPAHSVNVLQPDGSTRVECDHTFKGTRHCVHCGKSMNDLQREQRAEAAALQGELAPAPGVEQVEVVSIPLGRVLLRRAQALVATRRLGRDLGNVAQTLFVLGLLEAEGMDPRAHFGEPKQHISVDGAFLRFALPHTGPDREGILRSVFAWLHAWLGDDDPLAKAPAAALAALPR
jgi:hypothetical protein